MHPSQHPARVHGLTSTSHVTDGMAILHPTAQAAGQLISRLAAQMINKFIHEQQIEGARLVHLVRHRAGLKVRQMWVAEQRHLI